MDSSKVMEKRNYDNVLDEFAFRFKDLRRDQTKREGKKKSFKEISEEILKITGESISHTQLSKYYNIGHDADIRISPNIKSVLAIADYYDVSVEYLLGLSDTKYCEDKYKIGSKTFGLSDVSMEILEEMKNQLHIFNVCVFENNIYKKFSGVDLINFVLDNFLYDFQESFNKYFYEVQRLEQLVNFDKPIKSEHINVREQIKNEDESIDEIIFQKDFVSYRKHQIAQTVDKLIDNLIKELASKENEKEAD